MTVSVSIINLRQSDDHLRFIMGIPITMILSLLCEYPGICMEYHNDLSEEVWQVINIS